MVDSNLRVYGGSRSMVPYGPSAHSIGCSQRGWTFFLVLAITFFTFAIVLAPEAPSRQASICEEHNSLDACRVW